MKVKYSPQYSDDKFIYDFDNETIKIRLEIMGIEKYIDEVEDLIIDGDPLYNEETGEYDEQYKTVITPIQKERIVVKEVHEDTFDFSTTMPEGIIENPLEDIETTLPINPFISLKRENGEVYVELLHFYKWKETEEELNPKWKEV